MFERVVSLGLVSTEMSSRDCKPGKVLDPIDSGRIGTLASLFSFSKTCRSGNKNDEATT